MIDARVPRHGANPANLVPDGAHDQPDPAIAVIEADLGEVEPRRRPRRGRRRRRRVQPRRPGQPRRLDGRPAVRPRGEHHEPVPRSSSCCGARTPMRSWSTRRPARSSASRATCPVDEEHPVAPVDVNGITKYATEQLHLLYHDVYGLPASAVRLTNVFGPRQRLRDDFQGFLPIFVRRALADESISVFGDGAQERDCLYVDDVVECLLLAGVGPRRAGRDLQRRERRAPVARARSPRRSSRRRDRDASRTCRGHPIVTPSTSGRTSATRRRRSGCWAGSRARRSPEGIARTLAFYRARPRVVPMTRRRSNRDPVPSTSPAGPRRSSPTSPRRSTASCGRAVPARARAGRVRGRVRRVHRAPPRGRRGVGHRRAPARRWSPSGVGPGDEVIVPGVHRGARPPPRCARRVRRPVFVDVDPDTADIDVARARRRGHRPHPCRDPGAPLRAAGGASPTSVCPCSRTPRRRTARSTRRSRSAGRGVQLLSDEEPRRDRRRRRGRHRRRRARGDAAAAARARPHRRTTCTPRSRPTPGCPRSTRPRCASGCAGSRAGNARRREIAARYRAAAPDAALAGRPRSSRVPPVRRARPRPRRPSAIGSRSTPASHYPRALTQQPAYQEFVAVAVPGSGAMGRGVRIVPVLPRADRRRDRGGVSSDPVNPAVEAVSASSPVTTTKPPSPDGQRRVATLERVGVATARSSSSTTAPPTARPRCSRS